MQINIYIKSLIMFLIAVNIMNFCLFAWDKRCAQKDSWRIREQDLFMWAFIGGSIGGLLAMHIFHHKTLHPKFKYGFPAIILIQVTALFGFCHYLY